MTKEPIKDESDNQETNSEYPMTAIKDPHPHDVLNGRGGGTNVHLGNTHWRMLVATNKPLYVSLPKKQKQLLSKSIVSAVRSQDPPGRFLQKDGSNNTWFDIGDQRAQEKTSQALREGAKELKKAMVEKGELPADAADAEPNTNENGHAARQQPEEVSQDTSILEAEIAEKADVPSPLPPKFVETKSDEMMIPDAPGSSDFIQHVFVPPPPGDGTLEPPGLSFGSVSMGTSVLHDDGSLPMSRLESQGMSFGSTIAVPTTLEPAGLSIGSAMSYNTTYTQGTATARPVDGGLLGEGHGISIGSISMTSVEHQRIKDSLEGRHHGPAVVLPPTLLDQQRATGDLLADSDDDDDNDLPDDGQPRREPVDYDMLQQQLAYAEATRQYSASGSSSTMWSAPASRQYSSGSSTQPLPLDRDISSASSMARFMGDAFADQAELERKTASSAVDPTELLYGFSGFSLDSASGIAPPTLPDDAKQWQDLTDEEKLAMHLSRQESKGKATAEGELQHS